MLRNLSSSLRHRMSYRDLLQVQSSLCLTKLKFAAKPPAEKPPAAKPPAKAAAGPPAKDAKKDAKEPPKKDDKGAKKPPPAPIKKGPVMKSIKVYRFKPGVKPFLQSWTVDVNICGPMLQTVLTFIKARHDRTLTFRKSCREGKCGTCGVNVNGVNTLACICPLDGPTITVYPLPHMYVIRDLVTDCTRFYEQYRSIEPWLQRRNEMSEGKGIAQYLQHEQDSNKLNGLYQCILCACCQSACPSYWYGSSKYLGPAVLLQAYRWIIDSRDDAHDARLENLSDRNKVFMCATIMNCTKTCPINLNPGLQIAKLKLLLAGWAKKEKPKTETLGLNMSNKTL